MRYAQLALLAACAFFLAGAAAANAQTCGGHGTASSMNVTTAWLANHLHDPNLVIFSVGEYSRRA